MIPFLFPLFAAQAVIPPVATTAARLPETTLCSVDASDMEPAKILRLLSRQTGVNLLMLGASEAKITLRLSGVPLVEIIKHISAMTGLAYLKVGNAFVLGSAERLGAAYPQEWKASRPEPAIVVPPPAVEISTESYRTSFVSAASLAASLTGIFKDVQVVAGPASTSPAVASLDGSRATGSQATTLDAQDVGGVTRTILLQGPKPSVDRAMAFARRLDAPRAQVAIAVTVHDLSNDALKDLGLSWDFGGFTISEKPSGFNLGKVSRTGLSASAAIKAIESRGAAKLLASPSLSMLDGERGFVLIGNRINFPHPDGLYPEQRADLRHQGATSGNLSPSRGDRRRGRKRDDEPLSAGLHGYELPSGERRQLSSDLHARGPDYGTDRFGGKRGTRWADPRRGRELRREGADLGQHPGVGRTLSPPQDDPLVKPGHPHGDADGRLPREGKMILDRPIGDIFVEAGYLSRTELEYVLSHREDTTEPLGDLLVRTNRISLKDRLRCEAIQMGLPFVDLTQVEIEPECSRIIPHTMAMRLLCVPIERTEIAASVAMANPLDLTAIDELTESDRAGDRSRCSAPRRTSATRSSARSARTTTSASSSATPSWAARTTCAPRPTRTRTAVNVIELKEVVEGAPIVKLANAIMTRAISLRASDIHIEPQTRKVRIRLRIDGMLQETMVVPKDLQHGLTSRIKILAGLDIAERRMPQDGRCTLVAPARASTTSASRPIPACTARPSSSASSTSTPP